MTHHVMVDLETLGTGPNAVITSVGMVTFDPVSLVRIAKFQTGLNIQSQIDDGRTITAGTLAWWANQERFSDQFWSELSSNFDTAAEIAGFIGSDNCVWGNGAGFDNVILGSFLRDYGVPDKDLWKHWNDRCFRTFVKLFDPDKTLRPRSNDHDALRDAENQVQWMFNIISDRGLQSMF